MHNQWTDDEARFLDATFSPTSRMTEQMWLHAAKVFGRFDEWLTANPLTKDPE